MRLKPRHYVLLAVLIGLGIFNLVHFHRAKEKPGAAPGVTSRGVSPVWDDFDKAAAARDADNPTFEAALKGLNDAIDAASAQRFPPRPDAAELDGLRGCRTWLEFYRQYHLHPAAKNPVTPEQTRAHVEGCQAQHQDVSR